MHARTRKTRRIHNAQTRALQERDPSLINLPIPIPSIPILGPLLSPLIGGLPWPKSTASSTSTTKAQPTSTPAAVPTSTTAVPTSIAALPTQATSTAHASSPTGSSGDNPGGGGSSSGSGSIGSDTSSGGDGSSSGSGDGGSAGTSAGGDGDGSSSGSSVGPNGTGSSSSSSASGGDGTGSSASGDNSDSGGGSIGSTIGSSGAASGVSAGVNPDAGSSQSSAVAAGAGAASSSHSGSIVVSGSSAQASSNANGQGPSGNTSGGKAAEPGTSTTAVPMAVGNAFTGGSSGTAYTYGFAAGSSTVAAVGATGAAVSGSSSKGSGTYGSGSSGSDGDGSSSSGTTSTSTSHHGLTRGGIAAIVVVLVLLFVGIILLLLRRRSTNKRVQRRRNWLFGRQTTVYGNTGITSSQFFTDHPNGSTANMTERSSFGPAASHAPWETFSDSVGATAGGSAPSSRIELSVPPVGREMKGLTKPVWTSHLNGSMVFTPSLASLASSNVLPTIRSPDRTSWGSQKSMDKSSGEDGAWVSCPESAAVSTSSHGLPSSMSVRPFSPSEAWQFPKPPESRADDALPASYRRQSRASTRVVSPDSMFESGMSSEYATAPENPFSDPASAEPDTRTSESVDAETALHFARVEMIRRPFVPAMEDEMAVAPGDRVRMLRRFNDGWAYAEKVGTRRRGIIPIDCLRTPSEDLPAFLASKRLSSYRAGSVYAKSEEETGEPYVRFAI